VFAELLREPGVEEVLELRSDVGFLALHGGNQDRVSDEIATAAAARSGASLYAIVQPPTLRWHIPSYRHDPAESPRLRRFLSSVRVVISVHGYGVDSWRMDWRPPGFEETRLGRFHAREAFLVGGCNRARAAELANRLRAALPGYEVWDDLERIPPKASGLDPRNPVNLALDGGVQLECPPRVRGLGPSAADRADTDALVGVLAEVAAEWAARSTAGPTAAARPAARA
jgi:phage replication-related protein YjqB (UPF0714/DUF867 family)